MNTQKGFSKIVTIIIVVILVLIGIKIGASLIYSYSESESNRKRAESYREYVKNNQPQELNETASE